MGGDRDEGDIRILAVFGLLAGLVVFASPVSADTYFTEQVKYPYPAQYADEVVYVRLAHQTGGVDPLVGIPVHSVWNYRTTTSYADWQTGNDGIVALVRNIGDATCGYTVRVDLYVGDAQQQIDSAYFTPCGGSSNTSVAPAPAASVGPAYFAGNPNGYGSTICQILAGMPEQASHLRQQGYTEAQIDQMLGYGPCSSP